MSFIEEQIEAGRATETDLICERHAARVTGQPSLDQMIAHATRFNDDCVQDVMLSAVHLDSDEYAILEETVARLIETKRKARFA